MCLKIFMKNAMKSFSLRLLSILGLSLATALGTAVEALASRCLHKQNFRRLVGQQNLVEEIGAQTAGVTGRPAKLYRFRSDVLLKRAISGSRLPLARQD